MEGLGAPVNKLSRVEYIHMKLDLVCVFLVGIIIIIAIRLTEMDGFSQCAYQKKKDCGNIPQNASESVRKRYELCQTYNRNLGFVNKNCESFNKEVSRKMSEFIPLDSSQTKSCNDELQICNRENTGDRNCQEEYKMCVDVKREGIIRDKLRDNISPAPTDIDHTKCNYKLVRGGPIYEKTTDFQSFYEAPIQPNSSLDKLSLDEDRLQQTAFDSGLLSELFKGTVTQHSDVREYGDYEFKNIVGQSADPNYEKCEQNYMGADDNYKVIPSIGHIPCSDPSLPWHTPISGSDKERAYCGKSNPPCSYCGMFKSPTDPEIYQEYGYDTYLSAPNRYTHSSENDTLCENPDELQRMLEILPLHEAKILKHRCDMVRDARKLSDTPDRYVNDILCDYPHIFNNITATLPRNTKESLLRECSKIRNRNRKLSNRPKSGETGIASG
jgi:hypothetical protein